MSGGSMDYLSFHVDDARRFFKEDPEIQDLLKDVAGLLYAREWFDSGDTNYDTYQETVVYFKQKWFGDKRNREERMRDYVDAEVEKLKTTLLYTINPKYIESEQAFNELRED